MSGKPTQIGLSQEVLHVSVGQTPTVIGGRKPSSVVGSLPPTALAASPLPKPLPVQNTCPTNPLALNAPSSPIASLSKGLPETAIPAAPAGTKVVNKDFAPSAVPGTIRLPMQVDEAELSHAYKVSDPAVRAKAQDKLQEIVLALVTAQFATSFGVAEQKRYRNSVSDLLKSVTHDRVQVAQRHYSRLLELLQTMSDSALEKPGIFRRPKLLVDVLVEHRTELNELVQHLEISALHIEELCNQLRDAKREAHLLMVDVMATCVCCEILGERASAVGDIFTERGRSLLQTQAQCLDHDTQIDLHLQQFESLHTKINDAVLLQLPAWISAVIMSHGSVLNETQKFMQKSQLDNLIAALNP